MLSLVLELNLIHFLVLNFSQAFKTLVVYQNKLKKLIWDFFFWLLWIMQLWTPVCVYILMSMCVLSSVWLFLILWTVACQIPLSMGLSREEYWSGLLFPPLGSFPDPGIEPASPTLQADSLPLSHRGSPYIHVHTNNIYMCMYTHTHTYTYIYIFIANKYNQKVQEIKAATWNPSPGGNNCHRWQQSYQMFSHF